MDWRLEKRWSIGKTGFVSVVAEVLNTFLAKEVVGESCEIVADATDCEGGVCNSKEVCGPSTLGPVAIPSLGVEGGY